MTRRCRRSHACGQLPGVGRLMRRCRSEQVPRPAMRPRGVRIAIHAAGVSFATTLITAGQHQTKPPLPFTPGTEVAGVVTECARGRDAGEAGRSRLCRAGMGRPCGGSRRARAQRLSNPRRLAFRDCRAVSLVLRHRLRRAGLASGAEGRRDPARVRRQRRGRAGGGRGRQGPRRAGHRLRRVGGEGGGDARARRRPRAGRTARGPARRDPATRGQPWRGRGVRSGRRCRVRGRHARGGAAWPAWSSSASRRARARSCRRTSCW